jgi:hypothetical protein
LRAKSVSCWFTTAAKIAWILRRQFQIYNWLNHHNQQLVFKFVDTMSWNIVIVIFHKIHFCLVTLILLIVTYMTYECDPCLLFCDFKISRKVHDFESNENLLRITDFFSWLDGHI